ncbi:TlpA family protein disulfide reductase [Rathayibacter tanaceti]|uniref:TlpA family protein disulfide reductase n=1 Tax=Rathayibacter tanaceti TaxID=1671680 RepID=UPI0022A9D6C3|nr:MauE/DoxX family redox-associated membrane protein [Rathayibacter tanaceti]
MRGHRTRRQWRVEARARRGLPGEPRSARGSAHPPRPTAVRRRFPVVEIALGAAVVLAPAPLHRAALVPVALLDVVFLVVAIRAARAPEEVDCECFGGLGSARMTGRTVARNGALLALALAGLAGAVAPAALLASEEGGSPAATVASGLAAALAAVTLVLVRDRRAARDSPPSGADQEELELVTAAGERLTLTELSRPATHLVFFSPSCSSCHQLVERFRWWPNGLREGEELLPVLLGEREQFAEYAVYAPLIDHALYDPSGRVAAALGRSGTPGHVLLDPEHPRGTGWTAGAVGIEDRVLRPDFLADVAAGVVGPDPTVAPQ